MEPIYEGKAKRLFTTDNPNELLMEFKDDATAFNGEKKSSFAEKGRLNLDLSCLIFDELAKQGISTHHIKRLDETRLLVKKVDIIPLEVVIRNVVAGSLHKRLGYDEGHVLDAPLVEYYYKRDDLGDPMLTLDHIAILDVATDAELKTISELGLQVNEFLIGFFGKSGIRLIDFKLEFGRDTDGSILLADEISPDNCRLWDATSGERLDKDRFRRDLGDLLDGYREILGRLQGQS